MNSISGPAGQIPAAIEAKSTTAARGPGGAGATPRAQSQAADFNNHLAGLTRRESEASDANRQAYFSNSEACLSARQGIALGADGADIAGQESVTIGLRMRGGGMPRALANPLAGVSCPQGETEAPALLGRAPAGEHQFSAEGGGAEPELDFPAGTGLWLAQALPLLGNAPPASEMEAAPRSSAAASISSRGEKDRGACLAPYGAPSSASAAAGGALPEPLPAVPAALSLPSSLTDTVSLPAVAALSQFPGATPKPEPYPSGLNRPANGPSPQSFHPLQNGSLGADHAAADQFRRPGVNSMPDGDYALRFGSSRQFAVKVSAISQETYLAPATGFSLGLRFHSSIPPAPSLKRQDQPSGAAFPDGHRPLSAGSGLGLEVNQAADKIGAIYGRRSEFAHLASGSSGAPFEEHSPRDRLASLTPAVQQASPGGFQSAAGYFVWPANQSLNGFAGDGNYDSPVNIPPSPKDLSGRDIAALARGKADIVNKDIRLVSAKELSPALQIANLLAAPAGSVTLDAAAASVPPDGALDPARENVPQASRIQILQLQLEPDELGKVFVRMRLNGAKLDIRVETERPETLRLLGGERDLIARKLHAAGYEIEQLTVLAAEPQTTPQRQSATAISNGQEQTYGHAHGDSREHDRPAMRGGGQRPGCLPPEDGMDEASAHPYRGEFLL